MKEYDSGPWGAALKPQPLAWTGLASALSIKAEPGSSPAGLTLRQCTTQRPLHPKLFPDAFTSSPPDILHCQVLHLSSNPSPQNWSKVFVQESLPSLTTTLLTSLLHSSYWLRQSPKSWKSFSREWLITTARPCSPSKRIQDAAPTAPCCAHTPTHMHMPEMCVHTQKLV